jgi:N-acetylmuramoyl-L-alanine amidase
MTGLIRTFLMTILFMMVTCAAFIGAQTSAHALTVKDVRFGAHPDKVRVVLELDRQSIFRAFVLEAPYRIVIDMPAFGWYVGNISNPQESHVGTIRQGPLEPGISRIVMDMQRPAIIESAFVLPQSGALPARLVIDYKIVSRDRFARSLNSRFGTLQGSETVVASLTPPASSPSPSLSGTNRQSALNVPPPKPTPTSPLLLAPREKPLIVLDAGHGGNDPGAVGANGLFEKNIVLAMAREVRRQLEATGRYRVKLTRDKDVFLRLHQRVAIARDVDADLFVSLHADSINRSNVSGASIYTLSEKASDKQTARLAERENKADIIAGADLSHQDFQVANILIDLAMRDTMNQSKYFANTIVDSLRYNKIRLLERPHRYAGFAVLKAPDIPSVLIEVGFMSNRAEANKLSNDSYRRIIATAIVNGINQYFETVENNSRI